LRPYAPSPYVYASGNIFLELISFFGGSRNTQSAPHTRIATQDFYHHHQHEFTSTRDIGRSCRAEEEHWEVYEETGYRFEEREFEQDIWSFHRDYSHPKYLYSRASGTGCH
jgi:hypothetical protein